MAMTFRAACMEPDEQALWEAANRGMARPALRPCADCPAAFMSAMRAAERCNGNRLGRPRFAVHSEGRRRAWAEKSRAYRARHRERAA